MRTQHNDKHKKKTYCEVIITKKIQVMEYYQYRVYTYKNIKNCTQIMMVKSFENYFTPKCYTQIVIKFIFKFNSHLKT